MFHCTSCEWAPCKIDPKAEECQKPPKGNYAICRAETLEPDNNMKLDVYHDERYADGIMSCSFGVGGGTVHKKENSPNFSWDMPCVMTIDGSTLKVVTEFSSETQKGTYKFVDQKDEVVGQGELECDLGGPATPTD